MQKSIRERINGAVDEISMGISEAADVYRVCCWMMRAGFGACIYPEYKRTYATVATEMEDLIHLYDSENGKYIIADIRNSDI